MSGLRIGAALLVVMGCLAVLIELQSPTLVLWTGTHVEGYTQGGLTYYKYHGTAYTLDNERASAKDLRRVPTTVYFNPSDPAEGQLHGYLRWVDGFFVVIWFVGAAALLVADSMRRRRRSRRPPPIAFVVPRGPRSSP
jgi:hypothetical protein